MRILIQDGRRRFTVVIEAHPEEPATVETTGEEIHPGLAKCGERRTESGVVELSTRRRAAS